MLKNDGTVAGNVRVMAYGSSNNYLDAAFTDQVTGRAVFSTTKVPDGIQVRFKIFNLSNYPYFTYDSGLVMTPADLTVSLPVPTPVTVLNGGIDVQGVNVYAYDALNVSYGVGVTNASGLINCYINAGVQIKFVIKYGGFTSGESGFVTTPSSVTLNLPQPSSVTVLNGTSPVEGKRVDAYDDASNSLGYNTTNAQGIVTCYLAEGKLVKFRIQNPNYESSLLLTPVNHIINTAPPSTVTILNSGAGVPGIEVSAYDSGSNFLTSGITGSNGIAALYVSSGTQFTYSFSYKGYSHASGLLTAPSSNTVNLPAPSVITVLDQGQGMPGVGVYAFDVNHNFIALEYTDGSGDAYFYITGGLEATFEILYKGFEYTSGLVTTPFSQTVNLNPVSMVTVTDGVAPLSGVFVYAYGDNGNGLASGYTNSNGAAYFYFEGGRKVVFEAQYNSLRYFSDWIIAPSAGLIDISLPTKPAGVGSVRTEGRTLILNNSPYKIKGIAYQPTPVGEVPWTSNWANDARIFDRDFPILTGINVNTVRTWNRVTDTLMDSAAQYGMKVIAGYWIDPAIDYSDPAQRASIKADFKSYVAQFKNKPALLFWAVGNAQNRDVPADRLPYWYSLVNEMAYEAFMEERLFYHPVAVVNDSLGFVGDPGAGSDDVSIRYLDIWGTEVLTGATFGGYFDAYSVLSSKPLWIAAYGVDAYDNNTGSEDQAAQAAWLSQSATEIINSQLTIGGTLNEYSDEYWLAGNEWPHDTGGWPSAAGALPDNYANVEWWGIASVADNGTEPDIVTLRQAAVSLKDIFAAVSRVGSGQQYAAIQDALADPAHEDVIYVYPGTYNTGTLEINDNITLEGQGTPQPVINGNLVFLETQATVQNFTIYFNEGQNIAYTSSDGTYAGWRIITDAGVTAVNSVITLRDCIIQPNSPLSHYGKGIQIWNLYLSGEISPIIENCRISNTDSSIYLYSQSFGGAILGEIKNNVLDGNNYGVVLRMHKEKPIIRYNEITNSVNGIHITYEDGALLQERLNNITNNTFSGNAGDIWCDELGE